VKRPSLLVPRGPWLVATLLWALGLSAVVYVGTLKAATHNLPWLLLFGVVLPVLAQAAIRFLWRKAASIH
jgi:hypothetical protein